MSNSITNKVEDIVVHLLFTSAKLDYINICLLLCFLSVISVKPILVLLCICGNVTLCSSLLFSLVLESPKTTSQAEASTPPSFDDTQDAMLSQLVLKRLTDLKPLSQSYDTSQTGAKRRRGLVSGRSAVQYYTGLALCTWQIKLVWVMKRPRVILLQNCPKACCSDSAYKHTEKTSRQNTRITIINTKNYLLEEKKSAAD